MVKTDRNLLMIPIAVALTILVIAGIAMAMAEDDPEQPSVSMESGHTIRFDLNGGTGTCPEPVQVGPWSTYTLSYEKEPIRDGYDFAGWHTYKNLGDYRRALLEGDRMSVDNDMTLFAIWIPLMEMRYEKIDGYGDGFDFVDDVGEHRSLTPKDGSVFFIYRVEVKNLSVGRTVNPDYADFDLETTDGMYRPCEDSSFDRYVLKNEPASEIGLKQGESHTFCIVYEVPENTTNGIVVASHGFDGFEYRISEKRFRMV